MIRFFARVAGLSTLFLTTSQAFASDCLNVGDVAMICGYRITTHVEDTVQGTFVYETPDPEKAWDQPVELMMWVWANQVDMTQFEDLRDWAELDATSTHFASGVTFEEITINGYPALRWTGSVMSDAYMVVDVFYIDGSVLQVMSDMTLTQDQIAPHLAYRQTIYADMQIMAVSN